MSPELLVLTLGHAFSAVLQLVVGIFVLSHGPKKKENVLFFFLTFWVAFFNVYFAVASNLPPSQFSYNLWLLNSFNVFITISYVHFMLAAVKRDDAMKWFIWLTYAVGLVILILTALNPKLFLPEVTPKLYLASYLNAGPLYHAMLFHFLVFPLIAFLELVRAYLKGGLDKIRSEYYIATSVVGYGLGTFSFYLVYDIPIDPFLGMFVGWYVLPIAYGIVSTELLDIRLAVKRAFFYAFGIALITGALMALLLLNDYLVDKFPFIEVWTIPLLAAFVAMMLGRAFWAKSQESDQLKYEFITIATHKLRTPLTRIRWEVASMMESLKDKPELKEAVLRIDEANNRLIGLTNVLVQASETDTANYRANHKYFDLREVVLRAVERLQPLVEKKKLSLKLDIEPNFPLVSGDEDKITAVIDVLLENAAIYNNVGGQVRVVLKSVKKDILFRVEDTGIGIKPEDMKHMFTRFFRTYSAKIADTEGMGLGLAMSKSIIEKHRGSIHVESGGAGKGSAFWFKLPT